MLDGIENEGTKNTDKKRISPALKIGVVFLMLIILVSASLFFLWQPTSTERTYYYSVCIHPDNETENYVLYVPLPVDFEGEPLKENEHILLKNGSAVFSEVSKDDVWLLKIEGRGDVLLEANTSWSSIQVSKEGLEARLSTLNETKDTEYSVISEYNGDIEIELNFHVEVTEYSSSGFPTDGCLVDSVINGTVLYGNNKLDGTYENRCVSFP